MSYIFKVTNPLATIPIWPDVNSWKLDRYADKPASLSLEIAGAHGIADRAIVEAYYASEDGADSYSDIAFRGFVLPSDDRGEESSKIAIPSIEKMLDYRFTQLSRWPAGTTLTKILTHDWPASSAEVPGLLCQANNLIQPGSFVYGWSVVWVLQQGGTSYLGDLHALGDHVYIDSVKQAWSTTTISPLAPNHYWQDANSLYIYSVKNPYYSVILVEGSYETNIRLGTISLGTSTFTQSWRSASSQISREILRLLNAKGLEFQFVHNADGYTYLNASAAIGRGANAAELPTYKYTDYKIIKVRKNTTGGKIPLHALRGLGIGKGATRQAYTAASFPAGLRFVAQEEFSNQFYGQLAGTVAKLYADRQDTTAWEIEAEDDPAAMPGDYCKIIPEEDAPTIERIKQISESSDTMMKIYLGQRPKDAEDVIRAKFDVQDQLQRDLELEYASINISGQENVDNTYPCRIILKVPAADWDSELDNKWLLSVTFNAFESSIAQATTAEVHHGSAGTSQTSGSGGSHDDHDLKDVTSQVASGSLVQACSYAVDETIDSVPDTHGHDLAGGYNATMTDHTHGFANGTKPNAAAAHTVPTYSNPQQDAALAQLKKIRDGFGSLAYLTGTITIINASYPGGVAVPGSPFYDIALGESLDSVDVSGLIVTGENTIQVAISQYGGSGSVAARANVSLTGKVVLNTAQI